MLILTIRTDKPEAEVGLFKGNSQLAYNIWPAHRQLAETIHNKIKVLLGGNRKTLNDIQGIIIFKGPGSFTGLRIGFSVANALAVSLQIPVIAVDGKDWHKKGIKRLEKGETEIIALPEYGSLPHITLPNH